MDITFGLPAGIGNCRIWGYRPRKPAYAHQSCLYKIEAPYLKAPMRIITLSQKNESIDKKDSNTFMREVTKRAGPLPSEEVSVGLAANNMFSDDEQNIRI